MALFGALLRRTAIQRSNFAIAFQIRSLRSPRLNVIIGDRLKSDAGQESLPTRTAGPSMAKRTAQESFTNISTQSRPELKEPYLEYKPSGDENSERPASTGPLEYTNEEKAKFAEIAEIAEDDRYKNFKLDPFDSGFLDSNEPKAKPDYVIAELVEEVEVLQKLAQLGVQIHKWQNKQSLVAKIITLDWKDDCGPRIQYLYNQAGITYAEIPKLLTKNPLILCEEFRNLRERVEYLYAWRADKLDEGGWGLTVKNVKRILREDALWLSFPVERIRNRVRFFINQFQLSADELRRLTIQCPRALTYSLRNIVLFRLFMIEELGFPFEDLQKMIIRTPKLLTQNRTHLRLRFDCLQNLIGFGRQDLVDNSKVLIVRDYRLKERLGFLRHLNRAQFNREKPNYISALDMATTRDENFVTKVAKSTMKEYKDYLKS
ncbi:mTERF domain-containing protein 1 [Tropilaelaps mercedesae]|uniref:mTERF domain-containing protein 1 n=1 Tax=Tropilaelaps mercedesae TaxID=418985 RepID=A0A1V9Y1I3_9ACAR|nr:mTERF domain-containing protein 1 [Tropilaelaps mercedesae]